ncbi:chloramphenicol phosphotransferase CPT family protein [Paenibacillus tarimensis]|uniref:chloramphenicol phosphotransferase CPT family protein n=1 Tax=Paenibacillus tarimensis TaxID=416012 RepID=UPI001F2416AC|nr:AAA family ATPase [Paenibacillus tarimensis]MCF2946417.1 chloramphenicol phosphotransferase CPT family protein [Paenibacillus tarimensis]
MSPGTVIFLNGTSSSGKSSISLELQRILDEPYLHLSVDKFLYMLPVDYLSGDKPAHATKDAMLKVIKGMHHALPALVAAGNNLIVDHVLEERQWLEECVMLLKDYKVLFVSVICSLEELERRERERGDRNIGLAKYQYNLVHTHGVYDLEIDTEFNKPHECALQIKKCLHDTPHFNAFRELKLSAD